MLGVFLLLTFTHLELECQDFLVHVMQCMSAQIRPWFILSSERVLCGMESESMLILREKVPSTGSSEEG